MNRTWTSLTVLSLAMAFTAIGLAGCGKGKDQTETAEFGYRNDTESDAAPVTQAPVATPETSAGSSGRAQVTYEDAEAAFQNRRYEDAVTLFTSYTETRPENPWGHYMLGLSAWKAGRLGVAEKSFTRALELDPQHEKSLLNLSRVFLEAGRPAEAREPLTAALELPGNRAEAYRLVGRMEGALGHGPEAEAAYHQALVLDESDVWSMNNLGLLLIQGQRFDEALLPLARATELRPTSPVFHNNLGIALEGLGQLVEARRAYGTAVDQDPAYAKAVANLRRVETLTEDPVRGEVDLAACSLGFVERVGMWRTEGTAGSDVPDSTLVDLGVETPGDN